ncbi:hypothetical protein AB0L00_05060 [Actinoallomurus sp. NPDC052308]|uniref:hypothetical protein n=1 Tax=Actinoallomurus sp. NPDC052308 TaxID=3155530 RepID=UPI003420F7A4
MKHSAPSGQPVARRRTARLLPEDGILDPIAIDLAARGIRPVALTPTERRLAAARILAAGGTATTLARRLRTSHTTARALINEITHPSEAA